MFASYILVLCTLSHSLAPDIYIYISELFAAKPDSGITGSGNELECQNAKQVGCIAFKVRVTT